MTPQADRIAFSLYELTTPTQIAGLNAASAAISAQIVAAQATDTGNQNLWTPINTLIGQYQTELNNIDGNQRTTYSASDIVNSAKKVLGNFFFPNNTTQVIPSLSATNNVWTQLNPFALTYSVGLPYSQVWTTSPTNENTQIAAIQGYIASAQSNTDIENVTGQIAQSDLSMPVITFAAVQTLSSNLIAAITTWQTALNAEKTALMAIVDTTNQTINTAALNSVNTALTAISTWLVYPAFNPISPAPTGTVFNAINPATYTPAIIPSQLYSVDLTALSSAVTARASYVTTRTAQLNTILGTISQDVTTGNITSSSGYYGKAYSYLVLRLNSLSGSLMKLNGLQTALAAQAAIITNTQTTAATYFGILPTTGFQSNANGTQFVSLVDVSFLSPGDSVYVMADNQMEMSMAVKTIVGNAVTLNGPVPAKYATSSNVRLYKDLG